MKASYDSENDDILNDFYIPALSESTKYQRIAGFFTSSVLAIAARGISHFIRNQGSADFIIGATLTQADIKAITLGLSSPEQFLEGPMLKELDSFSEEFVKDHVSALGWMVAKGMLRIKVVVPVEADGHGKDMESLKGIFHQKVGILMDSNNDMITFSGSINETAGGWLANIEEFKVFRSWIESEREYLESDLRKMQKYLNGQAKNALVVDVPIAVKERLVRLAPSNIDNIDLSRYYGRKNISSEKRQTRYYQDEAIAEWRRKRWQGIAEMATGTGKTLFALRAIRSEVPTNVLTVVAVPSDILTKQWKKEVEQEFPGSLIIICSSKTFAWPEKLKVLIDYINLGHENRRIFVITTYHTGSSDRFRNIMNNCAGDRMALIADEVHHAGAARFSRILDINFKFRLGLSATPERPWDEEGEEKTNNFFGSKVIVYSIRQALKDQILCEYEYNIKLVSLEPDELEQYRALSQNIRTKILRFVKLFPQTAGMSFPRLLSEISHRDPESFRIIQSLLIRRSNQLKTARGKSNALREILNNNVLKRCLVYCNDMEHLNEVLQTFHSEGISVLKYDSSMSTEEKECNLQSFTNGNSNFMVAVKCLDEGVDLPICDSAILISSSKSEREFIQRRGRLLRKHPSKSLAKIFDIIILPVDLDSSSSSISETEYKIIDNEFSRAKLFAESATNKNEILSALNGIEASIASRIR